MKIKKVSTIVILLLVCLNLFQFLWYVNPIGFFGAPCVPDEETALAIARAFEERLAGRPWPSDDFWIVSGEYIEGSGRWIVRQSPPIDHFGRGNVYVVRARDGRVISWRSY